MARVSPVYKSGPKTELNNYRPISVISVLSKLLERLTHDQLFEFLETNKSITCNQAAFRKSLLTITSLISITDFWYEKIVHSNINLIIFVDLKKAFYTVAQDILLKKLLGYGRRGTTGDWFESYLNNRKQFCSLNGQHSKTRNVTCGIPQGCCLGPLLFIIYLDDLDKCPEFSRVALGGASGPPGAQLILTLSKFHELYPTNHHVSPRMCTFEESCLFLLFPKHRACLL